MNKQKEVKPAYIVVTGSGDTFEEEINGLIAEGYVPQGGLSTSTHMDTISGHGSREFQFTTRHQAMFKEK